MHTIRNRRPTLLIFLTNLKCFPIEVSFLKFLYMWMICENMKSFFKRNCKTMTVQVWKYRIFKRTIFWLLFPSVNIFILLHTKEDFTTLNCLNHTTSMLAELVKVTFWIALQWNFKSVYSHGSPNICKGSYSQVSVLNFSLGEGGSYIQFNPIYRKHCQVKCMCLFVQ